VPRWSPARPGSVFRADRQFLPCYDCNQETRRI
jgi:hypothetical protein